MSQISLKRKNENNEYKDPKKPKIDTSKCKSRQFCTCCGGRHDNLKSREKNSDLYIWSKNKNGEDQFLCYWCDNNCNKRSIFCDKNKSNNSFNSLLY